MLDAIAGHVARQPAPGAAVTVRPDEAAVPAYTISAGHPAIRAAAAALETVYPGEQVLLACIAGTLPATDLFERVLGAKTLFFSFSTADEKLHAPNEFMRIRRLREGMRAWEQLWRLLAAGPHRRPIRHSPSGRFSPRGPRRVQRSSSTSRCSTMANVVTPRWGTSPQRSMNNPCNP